MSKRKRKTASFDSEGIKQLAKDKPVVYKILDKSGENIYTGSAKRGRVMPRLEEHLPGAQDAIRGGAKLRILQYNSIAEAEAAEQRVISRSKPKYNKKGK
jgi:excinuclease ABC subunit C